MAAISLPGVTVNINIEPCGCAEQLAQINERLSHMATQDDVAAAVARLDTISGTLSAGFTSLTTAVAGVRQDIADLKVINPAIDLTPLNVSMDTLEAQVASVSTAVADVVELDSENPAPAP